MKIMLVRFANKNSHSYQTNHLEKLPENYCMHGYGLINLEKPFSCFKFKVSELSNSIQLASIISRYFNRAVTLIEHSAKK